MAKSNKRLNPSFLPENASKIKNQIKYLNKDVDKLTGWKQNGNNNQNSESNFQMI